MNHILKTNCIFCILNLLTIKDLKYRMSAVRLSVMLSVMLSVRLSVNPMSHTCDIGLILSLKCVRILGFLFFIISQRLIMKNTGHNRFAIMPSVCASPAPAESHPDWPPCTSERADSRSSDIAQWTDRGSYTS